MSGIVLLFYKVWIIGLTWNIDNRVKWLSLVNIKEPDKQAKIYVGRFLNLYIFCSMLINYVWITLSQYFYRFWAESSQQIRNIFLTFLCLFPNLCFASLYSTIEELTAEQTESLVWEHASKLREIFEGKVWDIQINIMQIQMKRNWKWYEDIIIAI